MNKPMIEFSRVSTTENLAASLGEEDVIQY